MRTVHLVRHGEPDYTPIEALGWPGAMGDLAPLTTRGVQQSEAVADELAGAGVVYLVTSPMTRALHTASVVGHRLALGVRVDFDLREWLPDDTFGWTTLTEVRAAADDLERCGGDWPAGETRHWEPLPAVRARTLDALRRHTARADGPMIAVCHDMVIRSLVGEAPTPYAAVRSIDLDDLDA